MKTFQSQTKLIDRRRRDFWQQLEDRLAHRAREEAKHILKTHKPDPFAPDVLATIRSIVQEAEAELCVPEGEKGGEEDRRGKASLFQTPPAESKGSDLRAKDNLHGSRTCLTCGCRYDKFLASLLAGIFRVSCADKEDKIAEQTKHQR
jgi:hypothetical protein